MGCVVGRDQHIKKHDVHIFIADTRGILNMNDPAARTLTIYGDILPRGQIS